MPDRSPPPGFSPPQIDLRQFYRLFFEETQENLDQLERMLLGTAWEQATDEDFHALFRCAHSIKGSAATFGFDAIAQLAHHLESVLDLWRKHLASPNTQVINHMLAAADVIRGMVQAHAQEQPIEPALLEQVAPVTAALESHYAAEAADDSAAPPAPAATAEPSTPASATPAAVQAVPAAAPSAAATQDSVSARPSSNAAPAAVAVDDNDFGFFTDAPGAPADLPTAESEETTKQAPPEPLTTANQSTAPAPLPPQTALPLQTPALPASEPSTLSNSSSNGNGLNHADTTMQSVRVPVDRVDEMVNLLGELVVSQTSLQQSILRLEKSQRDALQLQLDEQQALIRKMRDTVMHIRMVPAAQLFKRFPRLIHDLSQRLGKQVQLRTEGDSTELDKGIIERITDPLIHLLRNGMDHGFETPEERLKQNKPAEGTLWIRAQTHGSQVALQVQDDGRGLSRQKLLAIAASKGIEIPANAPDSQVWQLAFLPGVSTSQTVSDVSGRGVGMDVVKRNIESLGGRVEIESVAQQGTTITLWLPLTLAITDGLLIQAGAEQYIVPLSSVLESMPAKPLRIETLGNRAKIVHLNDNYYPVVALDTLMGIARPAAGAADAAEVEGRNATMLLLHAGSHRVGLLVDTLIGQQQVVIKSVETHYRKIPFISAATVLGDGQVALILDAPELAAMGQNSDWAAAQGAASARRASA